MMYSYSEDRLTQMIENVKNTIVYSLPIELMNTLRLMKNDKLFQFFTKMYLDLPSKFWRSCVKFR